ncbi:dUTPase [Heliorestis acidaminivorans]|uniref:dUTPase n=1 Tax=Heliorestis acidaminivorans TaxID=553427 RepID=A0A6I0F5U4_9FIRM|nr:dUTPase [Heliorestis acidaminivorans]KAB2954342.1 dUTPase [Heliorestis acidaminivorans]
MDREEGLKELTKQDRLSHIFELQSAFDNEIIKKRGLEQISREEWLQKETLAMISELSELLDEVNFKWWKNPKPINEDAVKEELIDILHFFVSMCLKAGLTPEELYERYKKKNQENFDRQAGLSKKKGYSF